MTAKMMPTRAASVALVVGLLLLVSSCTSPSAVHSSGMHDPLGYSGGSSIPDPYAMPDVTLTDTADQPYNLTNSPSRPVTLMFFGYTNCPDVCIAVLSDVATALQRIDPGDRDHIQVIFVTTDPARDKAKPMRRYLDRFDPTFIGLTGSMANIKKVAGQVGVDIQGMTKLPSGGYEIGHSAQVIGFNRKSGEVIWTPETPIADLKHDFGLLVERSR